MALKISELERYTDQQQSTINDVVAKLMMMQQFAAKATALFQEWSKRVVHHQQQIHQNYRLPKY